MNDTQYHQLADVFFQALEKKIDQIAQQHDIDYETHGNLMEITFENGSKIIVNRQEPLHQIWVATQKNGYHFDYVNEKWISHRENQSLDTIIDEAIIQQIGN